MSRRGEDDTSNHAVMTGAILGLTIVNWLVLIVILTQVIAK